MLEKVEAQIKQLTSQIEQSAASHNYLMGAVAGLNQLKTELLKESAEVAAQADELIDKLKNEIDSTPEEHQ